MKLVFIILLIPNFSFASNNWAEKMISINVSEIAANIKDKRLIIAVIDTGADVNHPLLEGRLWKNKNEIADNQIDDDKNGYVDDINGFNFSSFTNQIQDDHGHGTHIAGIVSSLTPNNFELMILKYYDTKSLYTDTILATAKSIRYAVDMGAKIINYSAGGPSRNSEEISAIKYALEKGVLIVAAAGNHGKNSDLYPYFPASYEFNNIISVASLDAFKNLLKSSNYGPKSVDLSAPGFEIMSALPKGKLGTMTGTSQATAFVTAGAAMVLAKFQYAPELIAQRLMASADQDVTVPSLNLNAALNFFDLSQNSIGWSEHQPKWQSQNAFSTDLEEMLDTHRRIQNKLPVDYSALHDL